MTDLIEIIHVNVLLDDIRNYVDVALHNGLGVELRRILFNSHYPISVMVCAAGNRDIVKKVREEWEKHTKVIFSRTLPSDEND